MLLIGFGEIGGLYEIQFDLNSQIIKKTSYYPAGGAIRVEDLVTPANSGVYYLLKDQINSSSVTLNDAGTSVAEMRYYPFGETRVSNGAMPTGQLFTGQKQVANIGLYNYNARYYDPHIGRFISADTMVQNFANPQTLNRYSYTVNNPIKYVDASGHCFGFAGGADTAACALFATAGPPGWIADAIILAVGVVVVVTVFVIAEDQLPQHTGSPVIEFQPPQHTGSSIIAPQLPQHTGSASANNETLPNTSSPFPLASSMPPLLHTPPFDITNYFELPYSLMSKPTGQRPPWRSGIKSALLARDGPFCVYCGKQFPENKLTIEHIEPWITIQGDATTREEEINIFHDTDNLALACKPCNSSKKAQSLLLWLARKIVGK